MYIGLYFIGKCNGERKFNEFQKVTENKRLDI